MKVRKTMTRKIIGALVLTLLVPAALSAQPERRRGGPGDATVRERPNVARALIDNRAALELSDDQVSRLEALARQTDERRTELRGLREQLGGGAEITEEQRTRLRESARAALTAEREVRTGIRSVLTMEQFDRAARLGEALGGLRGGNRGVRAPRFSRGDRIGPRAGREGFIGPRADRGRGAERLRRPQGPRFRPDSLQRRRPIG
jgi:hypothetical protein